MCEGLIEGSLACWRQPTQTSVSCFLESRIAPFLDHRLFCSQLTHGTPGMAEEEYLAFWLSHL